MDVKHEVRKGGIATELRFLNYGCGKKWSNGELENKAKKSRTLLNKIQKENGKLDEI